MPYRGVKKVVGWGCRFDSLTELKYVISIMDDYHFLRAPVSIFYHPGTKIPIDHIRRFHRPYAPDFLIRHKQTWKAYLVEVKPRVFQNHPQLALRKAVAENYISRKCLDWKYRIVFDDEIILSEEQLADFESGASLASTTEFTQWFHDYCQRIGYVFPDNLLSDLIITGRPIHQRWKQLRLL